MASNVQIANRCLQHLGATRISDLEEDSVNARAVNAAFESVKLKILRKHTWSCATKRTTLAALAAAPSFGKTTQYQLPSDFVRLLPPDPKFVYNDHDWQIEGRKLLTNDTGVLNLRYVYNVTDPNEMDPLFREAFSLELALDLCEELTQSNTKKKQLKEDRNDTIADAKRVNAIERPALEPPEDTWVTVRS